LGPRSWIHGMISGRAKDPGHHRHKSNASNGAPSTQWLTPHIRIIRGSASQEAAAASFQSFLTPPPRGFFVSNFSILHKDPRSGPASQGPRLLATPRPHRVPPHPSIPTVVPSFVVSIGARLSSRTSFTPSSPPFPVRLLFPRYRGRESNRSFDRTRWSIRQRV
jgi:hypothetical protein